MSIQIFLASYVRVSVWVFLVFYVFFQQGCWQEFYVLMQQSGFLATSFTPSYKCRLEK